MKYLKKRKKETQRALFFVWFTSFVLCGFYGKWSAVFIVFLVFTLRVKCCVHCVYIRSEMLCSLHQEWNAVFLVITSGVKCCVPCDYIRSEMLCSLWLHQEWNAVFLVFTWRVKCCVPCVYIDSKMLCSLCLHWQWNAAFIVFTLMVKWGIYFVYIEWQQNAVFIVFTSRTTCCVYCVYIDRKCCVHCVYIKNDMLCSQGKAFASTTLAVKCSQSASVKTLCSFRAPTVTSATDGIPPQCAKYRQVSKWPCKILPSKQAALENTTR